jgi:hypothetical protein
MIWWILTAGAFMLLYLGAKLETGGISKLAYNAGFRGVDLVTAVAIAYAESSGNPNAVGDQSLAPERGPSIGLWQINIGSKAHPDLAEWNLTDPLTNARAAFRVYQDAGNSFRPWSTFTSTRYQAFLQRANNEVLSV